jgi:3-phosphoshikimate 1-carboxyvinyltransferase
MLTVGEGDYTVSCHPQMQLRPMDVTFAALAELGATVSPLGTPGFLPARIRAEAGHRGASPARVSVPGDVSSQFLSGLLLSAPCQPGGLHLMVTTELVSRPYVELTLAVMARFGAEVDEPRPGEFVVAPTGYQGTDLVVEPDASAASYPLAAAAICGGRVQVQGLHLGSAQGDVGFATVLGEMGLTVTDRRDGAGSITVERVGSSIGGGTFDLTHLSDTAQTLAAVAAFASEPVRIEGIGFIRRKEIDRVAAVATELRRCGVDVRVDDDGWTIGPSTVSPAVIETYDDHRMAMSFALVGLRAPGIAIARPACVAKTFPGYWAMLEGLRASGSRVPVGP